MPTEVSTGVGDMNSVFTLAKQVTCVPHHLPGLSSLFTAYRGRYTRIPVQKLWCTAKDQLLSSPCSDEWLSSEAFVLYSKMVSFVLVCQKAGEPTAGHKEPESHSSAWFCIHPSNQLCSAFLLRVLLQPSPVHASQPQLRYG